MWLLVLILALVVIVLLIALKEKHEKRNEPEQGTLQYYLHKSKEYQNESINLALNEFIGLVKLSKKPSPQTSSVLRDCKISSSKFEAESIFFNAFVIDYCLFREISDNDLYKSISTRWLEHSLQAISIRNRDEAIALREGRMHEYFKALNMDIEAPEGSFSTHLGSAFIDNISDSHSTRPTELLGLASYNLNNIYEESLKILNRHLGSSIKSSQQQN